MFSKLTTPLAPGNSTTFCVAGPTDPSGLEERTEGVINLFEESDPSYSNAGMIVPEPGVVISVGHGGAFSADDPRIVPKKPNPNWNPQDETSPQHIPISPEEHAGLIKSDANYTPTCTIRILHCSVAKGSYPKELHEALGGQNTILSYPEFINFYYGGTYTCSKPSNKPAAGTSPPLGSAQNLAPIAYPPPKGFWEHIGDFFVRPPRPSSNPGFWVDAASYGP